MYGKYTRQEPSGIDQTPIEHEVGVDLAVTRGVNADELATIVGAIQHAITTHMERPDTQAALKLAGVEVLGLFGEKV